jgi:hypothetical protein
MNAKQKEQADILFLSSVVLGIPESELHLLYDLKSDTPYGVGNNWGAQWIFTDSLEGMERIR